MILFEDRDTFELILIKESFVGLESKFKTY